MPKTISSKYYRRAKADKDSLIDLIDFVHQPVILRNVENTLNDQLINEQRNNFQLLNAVGINNIQSSNELILINRFEQLNELDYNASDNYISNDDSSITDAHDSDRSNGNVYEEYNNYLNNNINNRKSFESELAKWAIENNITHVALNKLLEILKSKYPNLPSDARTLLKTPRKVVVKDVEPGHYCHFGLKNCIQKLFSRYSFQNIQIIEVYINIDGLPLSKSSNSELYPILCSLVKNRSVVDIVGVYHGNKKPTDANVYLREFVDEAIALTTDGILLNDRIYPFKIKAFICDTPAKAFIKFTKGHMGYYSCSKCYIEGSFFNNKITFPNSSNLRLRSDNDFRLKLQEEHHTGTSILESIPNLNMITDFPLDPMHLIYLGVVKKLLVSLWYNGKPSSKLSSVQITEISNLLVYQKKNIPCEFNRKPRSLNECARWKATEFKQFLHYTGPVVLKSVLSNDRYLNFITLHVAITILSSTKHFEYINYANSLLHYFVETFTILYGKQNISFNIHNLLHLCDDFKNFGCLEEFSAFPFENFMQSIKKLIRKNDKPLQQIIFRTYEQDCFIHSEKAERNMIPQLLDQHHKGPLIDISCSKQWEKILFCNFTLKIQEPDNCCCLHDGSIINIKNFVSNDVNNFLLGHKYQTLQDLYSQPCRSSQLKIFVVNNDISPLQKWNINEVAYKCIKLKFNDKFVIFPMLHSE